MRFFLLAFLTLLVSLDASTQKHHRFFPSGHEIQMNERGVGAIEPFRRKDIFVRIYVVDRAVRLVELDDEGRDGLCGSIDGGNQEFIYGSNVYLETIIYKTSFGYCLVGVGFAGADERILVFAYPTKTRPEVSSRDGTNVELLWTDDFETQFSGPVGVIHDGYEWSYGRRALSRIAYPHLNPEEYERFKNRPMNK